MPVLLISLCMILSCGRKPSGHYYEEMVDGIRVITNSLIETEAGIRLIEELSIGEAEGDENYMFAAPRDIGVFRKEVYATLDGNSAGAGNPASIKDK